MNPLFHKNIYELTHDDIQYLIDSEISEGQQIEFKRDLPAGNGRDAWYEEQKKIGAFARNKIANELIAFANTGGGYLLLGIGESGEKPPVAKSIEEIPNCRELADRLLNAIDDSIEPRLPSIAAAGVPTNGTSGVVVFYVPPSRIAPHRIDVKSTSREFYTRRGEKTEKMTMREITDSVIKSQSAFDRLLNTVNARRDVYEQYKPEILGNITGSEKVPRIQQLSGIRVTVLPIGVELHIEKVYDKHDLMRLNDYSASVNTSETELIMPHRSALFGEQFRPILRGARRSVATMSNYIQWHEVYSDGLVELGYKVVDEPDIYVGWVAAMALNAIQQVKMLLEDNGMSGAELALDVEIDNYKWQGAKKLSGERFKILQLNIDGHHYYGVSETNIHLPILSVASSGSLSEIIKTLVNDILNAAGIMSYDDFRM